MLYQLSYLPDRARIVGRVPMQGKTPSRRPLAIPEGPRAC